MLKPIHELAGSRYGTSGSAKLLVLAGWETTAEELNPLTISHTPMNTSHKPPGREERSPRPDPMTADSMPTRMVAYPTSPQTDSQPGTSFALNNVEQSIKPDTPRA